MVGHTDRPLVVLHHEQDRQLPKLRHVQALIKLTDVAGPIAEKGSRHSITAAVTECIALVAAGEGSTEGDRDALADEGVAAQQMVFF